MNIGHAFRWIIRDFRSGELTLLFLALFLAITCVSAMQLFSAMVRHEVEQSAAQFLGADVLVSSNVALPPQWQKKATQLGLTQTDTLSFLSMAVYKDQLQLVQIKAVKSLYPLRGKLTVTDNPGRTQALSVHMPTSGHVWVHPRVLTALSIQVGQSLMIGAAQFQISGVIAEDPGQRGDWFSISPQIIMNERDVASTTIIQPGSRLTYDWLLSGEKPALLELKQFLQPQLGEQYRWSDYLQSSPAIDDVTQRTLSYLNLASLMSLLLGGLAISMATLRYFQRHLKHVALLRCMGATQYQIIELYGVGLLTVGLLSTLCGILMGVIFQPLLVKWLGGMIIKTSGHVHVLAVILSFVIGVGLLLFFSLGNLWQLSKVTPINIFGHQHQTWLRQLWQPYVFALVMLMALAYWNTGSWLITAAAMLSLAGFVGIVLASFSGFSWMVQHTKMVLPLPLRFGLNNIARHQENSTLQVIGIGMALTAILSLVVFKNNVLDSWQQQLPANTANYFLININPDQVADLSTLLRNAQVEPTGIYPMVKGRLSTINDQAARHVLGEEAKHINALQRELNLSWTGDLPGENQIVEGIWPQADNPLNWVSVEMGLAKQLHLKLGDTVGLQVGDSLVKAQVVNFRQVRWDSFKPTFFMLFKPGLLNHLPQTMITSFYLPPEQLPLLTRLTRDFPNITLIDVAGMLHKVRVLIHQVGNAMNFMTLFALLIGMVIAVLAVLSFNSSKQQETQVLKVLGMRRRTLLWIRSSEALIIGLYTGLLACIIALTLGYSLSMRMLNTAFAFPWSLLFLVPLLTAIVNLSLTAGIQYLQYKHRG